MANSPLLAMPMLNYVTSLGADIAAKDPQSPLPSSLTGLLSIGNLFNDAGDTPSHLHLWDNDYATTCKIVNWPGPRNSLVCGAIENIGVKVLNFYDAFSPGISGETAWGYDKSMPEIRNYNSIRHAICRPYSSRSALARYWELLNPIEPRYGESNNVFVDKSIAWGKALIWRVSTNHSSSVQPVTCGVAYSRWQKDRELRKWLFFQAIENPPGSREKDGYFYGISINGDWVPTFWGATTNLSNCWTGNTTSLIWNVDVIFGALYIYAGIKDLNGFLSFTNYLKNNRYLSSRVYDKYCKWTTSSANTVNWNGLFDSYGGLRNKNEFIAVMKASLVGDYNVYYQNQLRYNKSCYYDPWVITGGCEFTLYGYKDLNAAQGVYIAYLDMWLRLITMGEIIRDKGINAFPIDLNAMWNAFKTNGVYNADYIRSISTNGNFTGALSGLNF